MIKKSEINTTVILLLDLGAVGAGAASATIGARLQWARLWLERRAIASASETSSVVNVQSGTEHSTTTMTKRSTVSWSELLGWLCFNYNDETVLQGETQYKYAEWQEQ